MHRFCSLCHRAPVPCQRQERLHTAEDTQPQYIEIRPAEDDTFLKFQVVYLRFDLPLAPLRRKRGFKLRRKYSLLSSSIAVNSAIFTALLAMRSSIYPLKL